MVFSRERELRPDNRFQAGRARSFMEAWRAVDTVAIEERERRVAEVGGAIHERFRQRRALKKAEGRGDVKFDVRRGHSGKLATTEDTKDTEVKTDVKPLLPSVLSVLRGE